MKNNNSWYVTSLLHTICSCWKGSRRWSRRWMERSSWKMENPTRKKRISDKNRRRWTWSPRRRWFSVSVIVTLSSSLKYDQIRRFKSFESFYLFDIFFYLWMEFRFTSYFLFFTLTHFLNRYLFSLIFNKT